MGTQTNVKFSRVTTPVAQALATLQEDVFAPLAIKLRRFSRIEPTGEVEFPGYVAVGRLLKVESVDEVLNEVGRGESFGLGYLVGVPAYVYLNFFEFTGDSYTMQLTFDASLLYYHDAENDAGDVLERILTAIVTALDLDVCGYDASDRYARTFDALSVTEIVSGLRAGQLLTQSPPFYYAIKTAHLSKQEVRSAAAGTAARYKVQGGRHILSAWPP